MIYKEIKLVLDILEISVSDIAKAKKLAPGNVSNTLSGKEKRPKTRSKILDFICDEMRSKTFDHRFDADASARNGK